jgi:hypothetical protein
VEHPRDATRDTVPAGGPSAVRAHLTLAAGLALCAAAFWFELHRALGGNELSWAYVFEWPLLGAFAVYMWWRTLHPIQRAKRVVPASESPEYERMRVAWEEHQATLHSVDAESAAPDERPLP